MRADKKTKALAKQLFKLSLVNGGVSPEQVAGVSPEQVAGVLGYIERAQPRHPLTLLKLYHRAIVTEVAKSRAIVEHAGSVSDTTLRLIEGAMSRKYSRPVTATAQPNAKLLAGLRIRIGSDVYEANVSGQLAALSSAV